MTLNKPVIYESPEWQFLVQEEDPSRAAALYQKLAAGLERADVTGYLLAGVMHYCADHGLDFRAELDQARRHR